MNTDTASTMRQSRLARARMIRRRVVGGAVALFVATWLLIAVVLVSGHDPALAAHSTTTSSTASTAASTSAGSGSGSGSSPTVTTSTSGSANSGTAATSSGTSGTSLGSVSTRQS